MHLKISSLKWRPYCPRGDELSVQVKAEMGTTTRGKCSYTSITHIWPVTITPTLHQLEYHGAVTRCWSIFWLLMLWCLDSRPSAHSIHVVSYPSRFVRIFCFESWPHYGCEFIFNSEKRKSIIGWINQDNVTWCHWPPQKCLIFLD